MKSFYLILLLAFAAIMASCSSGKSQLTYFKDLEQVSTTQMPKSVPLKLGAGDELYILVQADEPKAAAPYNMISSAVGERENILQSNITPKAQTYLVNTRGDIDFPQLGWIHVAGMTVEELQDYLTRRIGQMIDNPIVTVELVNFRVSVLGEVLKPGPVRVTRTRYSILDALADAGDMTPYGLRDQVLLIRDNNGVQERVQLDLTSSEVLTSPYFYLQPNDYIYIKPNKIREANARYNSERGQRLQVVSTVVSASSVIASLMIALFVK